MTSGIGGGPNRSSSDDSTLFPEDEATLVGNVVSVGRLSVLDTGFSEDELFVSGVLMVGLDSTSFRNELALFEDAIFTGSETAFIKSVFGS
jgi:hypothetical protein